MYEGVAHNPSRTQSRHWLPTRGSSVNHDQNCVTLDSALSKTSTMTSSSAVRPLPLGKDCLDSSQSTSLCLPLDARCAPTRSVALLCRSSDSPALEIVSKIWSKMEGVAGCCDDRGEEGCDILQPCVSGKYDAWVDSPEWDRRWVLSGVIGGVESASVCVSSSKGTWCRLPNRVRYLEKSNSAGPSRKVFAKLVRRPTSKSSSEPAAESLRLSWYSGCTRKELLLSSIQDCYSIVADLRRLLAASVVGGQGCMTSHDKPKFEFQPQVHNVP